MDHAMTMRSFERVGYFHPVSQNLFRWHRAFDQAVGETLAFQKLHDHVVIAIDLANVVECTDVWMRKAGDRTRLALEPLAQLSIVRYVAGNHFDGHDAIEPRIARAINFTHSAGAGGRQNLVGPDLLARSEGH